MQTAPRQINNEPNIYFIEQIKSAVERESPKKRQSGKWLRGPESNKYYDGRWVKWQQVRDEQGARSRVWFNNLFYLDAQTISYSGQSSVLPTQGHLSRVRSCVKHQDVLAMCAMTQSLTTQIFSTSFSFHFLLPPFLFISLIKLIPFSSLTSFHSFSTACLSAISPHLFGDRQIKKKKGRVIDHLQLSWKSLHWGLVIVTAFIAFYQEPSDWKENLISLDMHTCCICIHNRKSNPLFIHTIHTSVVRHTLKACMQCKVSICSDMHTSTGTGL